MSGGDIALYAITPGVEALRAKVIREADLQATNDGPNFVAKGCHLKNRLRLNYLHRLRQYAQHRKPGPNQAFDVTVQDANHQPAAPLVGVGEDNACQLEERQETLMQHFESVRALSL